MRFAPESAMKRLPDESRARPHGWESWAERAGPRSEGAAIDGEDPDHLLAERRQIVEILVDLRASDLTRPVHVQGGRREGLTGASPGLGDSEAQTGALG